MALKPLYAGHEPLGVFDGLDGEATTLKGGEVVSFQYTTFGGVDKAAKDIDDGYMGTTSKKRPAVTKTLVSGMRPLFLCDEGTTGYGTLFGEVVGASAGQVVTGGSFLGPHTATGSGKVTLWDKPGLYAVTLDAVDTTAATGLSPENANLQGSTSLYATTAGLLTPAVGSAFDAGVVVARFIEFTTNGSLVNTPVHLVSALNSPSGQGGAKMAFTQAVIYFHPEWV